MGMLEQVYDHSPIFFQNVMCSVRGYQKNQTRYGKTYWEYRRLLEEFDTWSLKEKEAYQADQLHKFLTHAVNNSPFYARLYDGIDIDEIRSTADLKRLPVVDKEMLRQNEDSVSTIPKNDAVISTTGGTTGKTLVVRYTVEDFMRRMAMLDHFRARVGFENRKMKRAIFNANYIVPPKQTKKVFWRYNAASRQMIYSSFFLTQENIPYYIESMNRFKPDAIEGYFTSILEIANFMERNNLKPAFHPVAIFPTSETVTASGRRTIEKIFGCKVYDQYASSEGAPFVTECKEQRLHVEMADGVIEHASEHDDEILVTSFLTHGTPLIRYRIGDCMEFSDQAECPCGRCGPQISEIHGRSLDFLYTADGAKVTEFDVLLDCLPKMLVHTQFRQSVKDEVTILLQIDQKYFDPNYREKLVKSAKYVLGDKMKVNIQIVDEIPRAASGKFRLIVNECKE